jgi:hypothetical protein
VKLAFSLEKFRAYSTAASSGGGQTSSSGGSVNTTSAAGGEQTKTSGDGGVEVTWGTAYTGSIGDHNHSGEVTAGGGHSHDFQRVTGHKHNVTIDDHTHSITIGSHTHSIGDHTHSVSNHTHGLTYGIYESVSTASGCKIYVNSILRLDNGGAGYSTDQNNLLLTNWIVPGWNTIEISSGTLGRIDASVYIKSFVGTDEA